MKDEIRRMRDEFGKSQDLRTRTKRFALREIRLYGSFPITTEVKITEAIGKFMPISLIS